MSFKTNRKKILEARENLLGGPGSHLQADIEQMLKPKHSQGTAKDVDVFGRNKEQREMARLIRAGTKGIRIK